MELYARFMFTLAFGLAGVGVVMTSVFETLLSDWDPVVAARRWWRRHAHLRMSGRGVRAEDILQELEGRRRQDLRDLREAEQRLADPVAAQTL